MHRKIWVFLISLMFMLSGFGQSSGFHMNAFTEIKDSDGLATIQRVGRIQMLGELILTPALGLNIRMGNILESRGFDVHVRSKLRDFFGENKSYDRWISVQLELNRDSKAAVNILSLNRYALLWLETFQSNFSARENLILESLLEELFSEGLVQWKNDSVSNQEPYLLQSYAFVSVSSDHKVQIHHLKTRHRLFPVEKQRGIFPVNNFQFMNFVPPLLMKADMQAFIRLQYSKPGIYFSSEQIEAR